MTVSKIIKSILLGLVYTTNLFFALCLWLCGESGNILIGIFMIILYRLSLWFAPLLVTVIYWIPLKPRVPIRTKLLHNLILLLLCGVLFVLCYLIFGNWY